MGASTLEAPTFGSSLSSSLTYLTAGAFALALLVVLVVLALPLRAV